MKVLAEISYRDATTETKTTWSLNEATGLHTVAGGGTVFETKAVLEARREFRRHVKAATRYILDPRTDQGPQPFFFYCCGAACPGLPFRASEQSHPASCAGGSSSDAAMGAVAADLPKV